MYVGFDWEYSAKKFFFNFWYIHRKKVIFKYIGFDWEYSQKWIFDNFEKKEISFDMITKKKVKTQKNKIYLFNFYDHEKKSKNTKK